MGRSRRRKFSPEPFQVEIDSMSHDGRGVAVQEGKKVFLTGALPGERVLARLTARMRRFDEAEVIEVLRPSPQRVQPRCPHFGVCGGCALQHMDAVAQVDVKQETLLQNLQRIGSVTPQRVLDPLTGPAWHYRRKARLSVRYVHKKERLLVGFRERKGRFVADMNECHVLDKRVADLIPELNALIAGLDAYDRIPQIEAACGDHLCALIVRHMDPLSRADSEALASFARAHGVAVLLQPGGPESIQPLEPSSPVLDYALPAYGIVLEFGPADFIQVNAEMNRAMIDLALHLLEPEPSDQVLDLFCGLGNFTLPLATRAGRVTGVEGDAGLLEKAWANARRNQIENVEFHSADLTAQAEGASWLVRGYDRILLDPPRSGAQEILSHVAASPAHRLVYVSCHPASLARDAGILVHQYGYALTAAGVMDMFPHTGHVESIACFDRKRKA